MDDFTSNANKGLIWNLLITNGAFKDLKEADYDSVKNMFEEIIKKEAMSNQQADMIDKNKSVLIKIKNGLRSFTQSKPEYITADEISRSRQEEFSMNLQKKTEDFNNAITLKPPPDIDFQDNVYDEPLKEQLGNIVDNMVRKREEELNQVIKTHDVESANKWLNNETSTPVENKKSVKIVEPMEEIINKPNVLDKFKVKDRDLIVKEVRDKINYMKQELSELETKLNEII